MAEVAAERLSRRPAAGADGRSETESAFLHMGRTMKEDLEAVAERLKPVFPAEFGVVAAYAESYHEHFAAHLGALVQFELCERDVYMLLVWVQNFYPNDILNSPKLAGELQGLRLGSLLPAPQIRLLEATFLSNEVANVKELMSRALELESQRWAQDVAPRGWTAAATVSWLSTSCRSSPRDRPRPRPSLLTWACRHRRCCWWSWPSS